MGKLKKTIKKTLLWMIRFYQKNFSPDHSYHAKKHPYGYCRFYPTCSEYSYQAINKFGAVKSGFKALGRMLRCHPFSRGGYDPVK